MKSESGFTLVEMLIVLVIISILIVLTVANLSKNKEVAEAKECEALKNIIENQMKVYEIDQDAAVEDIQLLIEDGYIQTNTCRNGITYTIEGGEVVGDGST
ncbi:prepilin-type N-terminal cleavage/methylation domain-containing protein [Bacillaceae bacterium SIJ1]|uniref:competence type IV pilus major pilin ComGC n=1 Tax=Litoribacterium kuwaitense TaxID=1398745 RepID=UPI0013EDD20B|nr:competence type IV pilus major pilin ComGC [Litoribacterium kuwaitense]NGP43575.1 prepilin-type N-terminal cleavage/methylation domain-containing protein [Litoribacterium kuwaitense]